MGDRIRMIPDYNIDILVSILAEKLDYNHRLMNIPHMWLETQGQGIRVAVLDTGVPKHLDLRPSGGHSMIPGYRGDLEGHATHCAGIIAALANNDMGVAGIAPQVEDYYCAVLGPDGQGDIDSVVRGIRWAVDDIGAHIISMSLGISAAAIGRIPKLEEACDYAATNGTAVFAAAGNEATQVSYPARYDSVIAVAAVDNQKQHAAFSNFGSEIDFAAGGVNVYSTYLHNQYARLSGTSMACPAMAAVAALILAKHAKVGMGRTNTLTPTELKDHLKRIAFDVGDQGFDSLYGNGIPIFGRGAHVPTDEPDEEPVTDTKPKQGPKTNCVCWELWTTFIGKVVYDMDKNQGHQASTQLSRAVMGGLRAVDTKTGVITAALNKSEKS